MFEEHELDRVESLEPTYEGLNDGRRGLEGLRVTGLEPTYEGLKLVVVFVSSPCKTRLEPTYEGLKQNTTTKGRRHTCSVWSLPMRD